MRPLRIVICNTSETKRDPRVRRIAGTLADLGHDVTVLGLAGGAEPAEERFDNIRLRRIAMPQKCSSREMRELTESCPAAGRILEQCNSQVLSYLWDWVLGLPKGGHRAYHLIRRSRSLLRRLCGLRPAWPLVERRADEILNIRCILLFSLALYREALPLKPDVVHCNDLDTLLAGYMLKQTLGVKLVYDAHEIYPEQFAEGMRPPLWREFYINLEKALLPHTDARLTVCDSLGEYFQSEYGARPFATVRNVPSLKLLAPPKVLHRRQATRKVLYHGMYFAHRGLEEMIVAAQYLKNAVLVLRGLGPQEQSLRELAARLNLGDKVRFMLPVQVNELISHAADCDIGINPFLPVHKTTVYCLPNKFFEYMAAGLALASSDLVEMRRLTDRHGLGVLFPSQEPRQMAEVLAAVVDDQPRLEQFRRNAYEAVQSEFNWEKEQTKLANLYEEACAA